MAERKQTKVAAGKMYREPGFPVSIVTTNDATGQTITKINITSLVAPDRKYPAELASIEYDELSREFMLCFGQRARDKSIRSLVEVGMTEVAMRDAFDSIDACSPSIPDILILCRAKPIPLYDFNVEPRDNRVVRFQANVIISAFNGTEAILDFYVISPFSAHVIKNGDTTTTVQSEIRIQTATGLVASLRDRYRELQKINQQAI